MKIGNLKIYGIIYKITNKINNKVYIGQTKLGFKIRYKFKGNTGIEKVYNHHKHLKTHRYNAFNKHLYESIEKYGFDNFETIEVFDIAFSKQELDTKEKCWISIYDSYKKGYNHTLGGEGGSGYKHTKEAIEKIRFNSTGKNNPRYGVKLSQETKDKILNNRTYTKKSRELLSIGIKKE